MKYTIFISQTEQQLGNIRIPKNALILKEESGELTMCKDFPRNYKGQNPLLKIWYWDTIHEVWECDLWRNNTTRLLWQAYVKGGSKKLPRLIRPQVEKIYSQVPHNTKIGNVQMPCMCDPERKRLADHQTTDYECVKPSIYNYYSSIGTYGKAGAYMRV